MPIPDPDPAALAAFWADARAAIAASAPEVQLPEEPPSAWGFGGTPEHADALLDLVLRGVKTGTASAVWDFEASGEEFPAPGQLDIILDGAGRPRAVIQNTAHAVVPFDEVDAEHAHAEGEGDRSLDHWRASHERFFTEFAEHERGFSPSMPVLIERFRVLHP
ncbi:ASCH domain-containing protein [Microbacterium sp. MEC084]|uniref:ASCH domain-containing protein n=1 Tax=unclassified Microbacterium TaxID=2609290 RepID=UPI000B1A2313|nr:MULTISPECIES: ASCH domain-containing protein [unclassified Microbacterium]MCD1267580.1 ASCH domain-containing protein [Microbacterium sp. MEC084]